jgi:hypothetical protein
MPRFVKCILFGWIVIFALSACKKEARVERLLTGKWKRKGCKNVIYTYVCPRCIPGKISFLEGNMYYIDSSGHYHGSNPIGPYSYSYSNGYLQLDNYTCLDINITSPQLKIVSITKNRMVIKDLGEFEYKYTYYKIDE